MMCGVLVAWPASLVLVEIPSVPIEHEVLNLKRSC